MSLGRDAHRFYEQTKFVRTNDFLWTMVSFRKKRTMEERLGSFTEMKKRRFFYERTIFTKQTIFRIKFFKNSRFFTEQRIVSNKLSKNINFLTERNFIERTIFLNKRLYWTIVHWFLRTNEINFFSDWKRSNEMDLSRTMNSRNEKGMIAPISKPGSGVYMKDLDLEFDKITLIVTNKE